MDLLQLRYFQKVARLEHMTKAAQELQIAQPALSMTIARLENDLGVPLFDRQGRQIRLNAYGKAFLSKAETALRALEEGRCEIAEMSGLEHGQISLAVTTLTRFSKLLGSFLSVHPNVSFRVIQAPTEESKTQLLESGEIDFCFSYHPFEQPKVCNLPLFTEDIVLAVPFSHRLASRKSISLHEVAHDSFVSLKAGYSFRGITDECCRKAGFTPNIVCEGDEPAALEGLVRAGLGIAFLPAAAKQEDTSFHLLDIEEPVCQWTLYLTWVEQRYLSQAAREFHNFVVRLYGKK